MLNRIYIWGQICSQLYFFGCSNMEMVIVAYMCKIIITDIIVEFTKKNSFLNHI